MRRLSLPLRSHRERMALARRIAPLRAGTADDPPRDTHSEAGVPLPRWLDVMLVRADISSQRSQWPILAALTLPPISAWLAGGLVPAAVFAAAPPAMLLLWLHRRARRHLDTFITDLPLLLDSVQQLLRVGHSLQQAMARSIEQAGLPVRRFLMPAVHRIHNGMAPADALQWAAGRIGLAELHMLAAAVRVNGRYGGSMSGILANLGAMLRHAARVERELKAATAEARYSGIVLMAMPLVIAAMMMVLNPDYLRFFIETAQGRRMAMLALLLQGTGMVLMRRLMRLAF